MADKTGAGNPPAGEQPPSAGGPGSATAGGAGDPPPNIQFIYPDKKPPTGSNNSPHKTKEKRKTKVKKSTGGAPKSKFTNNTVGRAHMGQGKKLSLSEMIAAQEKAMGDHASDADKSQYWDAAAKHSALQFLQTNQSSPTWIAADNAYRLANNGTSMSGQITNGVNSGQAFATTNGQFNSLNDELQTMTKQIQFSDAMLDLGSNLVGDGAGKLGKEALEKILESSWFRKLMQKLGKKGEQIRRYLKKALKNDCKTSKSNPVFVTTGETVDFEPGFQVPGSIPIDLSSVYLSSLEWNGPLGRNRISAIDAFIERTKDGRLRLVDETIFPVHFAQPVAEPGVWSRGDTTRPVSLSAGAKRSFIAREGVLERRFEKYKDEIWRLSTIEDRNGLKIIFHRDQTGLLTRIDHPDGLAVEFDNTGPLRSAARLVSIEGRACPILRYAYDHSQNLTIIDNLFGDDLRCSYDAMDRKQVTAYGNGYWCKRTFDEKGRTSTVATNGPFDKDEFGYDDVARTTRYLPGGDLSKAEISVHGPGETTSIEINALGHEEHTEFNDEGHISARIDGEGNRVEFGYDGYGYIRSVKDAEGNSTFYTNNMYGQTQIERDEEGNRWVFDYDDHQNLKRITDPIGHITEIVNGDRGRPTKIMRHDGMMEQRAYDSHGWLVELIDFRGAKSSFTYDDFGRLTLIRDALGHEIAYAYDEQQGLDFWTPSHTTLDQGWTTSVRIDREKRERIDTDGQGRRTIHRFGPRNILKESEDSLGHTIRYFYDGLERLTRIENQIGATWTFERDAAGRVVRETSFDGLVVDYAYDKADRMIAATRADGGRAEFRLDREGRVLCETVVHPDAPSPVETHVNYDGRGLVQRAWNRHVSVTLERDKNGRIVTETSNNRSIASDYDCCGNRVERKIEDLVVEMSYDPKGALRAISFADHEPLRFRLDALGREEQRVSTAGFALDLARNAVGQLLRQVAGHHDAGSGDSGAAPVLQPQTIRTFTWPKGFEPTSIGDNRWGTVSYQYDARVQVLAANYSDGSRERFGYDSAMTVQWSEMDWSAGKTTRSDGGAWKSNAAGRTATAHGPAGETIVLSHDGRGRVVRREVRQTSGIKAVWRYEWDGRDQLVQCISPDGETWAYVYDPFGRRVEKRRVLTEPQMAWVATRYAEVVPTTQRSGSALDVWPEIPKGHDPTDVRPPIVGSRYLWDGDCMVEETPLRLDGSVDRDSAVHWHYEPGGVVPLARGDAAGLHYIVNDHLGSPREVMSEAGFVTWSGAHTVWGVPRAPVADARDVASAPCANMPIVFPGQWADAETGLCYNRYRHYDPLSAQYVSPDPIGLAGGPSVYGYVTSPTWWADPFGLYGVYVFQVLGSKCYVGMGGVGRMAASMIARTGVQAIQGRKPTKKQQASQKCTRAVHHDLDQHAKQVGMTPKDYSSLVENRLLGQNYPVGFGAAASPDWLNSKLDGQLAWAQAASNPAARQLATGDAEAISSGPGGFGSC